GIDKDILEGIINQYEFRLREGDNPQKGLTYLFQSRNGWAYAEDPFLSLKWEKPLAATKKAVKSDKIETLIKDKLLDNSHSLLIALVPKPGLQAEWNKEERQELAEFKGSLSEAQVDSLIEQTEELKAYQKKEDSPEDLAKMPLLEIDEIDSTAKYFDIKEQNIHGIKELYYNTFTNDIFYTKFLFDTRVLSKDQIPYMRLLSTVLGDLNTENYSFGELNNELNTYLGDFSAGYRTDLEDYNDDKLFANFVVNSKVLTKKSDKLFELTNEVLHNSKIDDKERLKTLLTEHQSELEANVRRNGLGVAATRISSYYSKEGKFNELTRGYTYYNFITDLMEK
ncbi:MAG: peptidase, partial [Halanaerobiales bacterium]